MTHKSLSQLVSLCLLVSVGCSLATDNSGEEVKPPRGRRQAFSSAVERDVQLWKAGNSDSSSFNRRDVAAPSEMTLVETLWNENQDLVQQFLDVEFLRFQAQHLENETLPSYQYYSIQDYYYLVDFVQYRALRMTTYPEFNATALLVTMTTEAESIVSSTRYAWEFRNETLVRDLKIPASYIDDGLRAGAEMAYADWLQKNTDLGWFTMHVMSIPCIYGWGQLANHLYNQTTTLQNTAFYNTWILPNRGSGSGARLSAFLEEYKAEYNSLEANRTWTAVFRQALRFEIDLFNSALGKSLDSLEIDS